MEDPLAAAKLAYTMKGAPLHSITRNP